MKLRWRDLSAALLRMSAGDMRVAIGRMSASLRNQVMIESPLLEAMSERADTESLELVRRLVCDVVWELAVGVSAYTFISNLL